MIIFNYRAALVQMQEAEAPAVHHSRVLDTQAAPLPSAAQASHSAPGAEVLQQDTVHGMTRGDVEGAAAAHDPEQAGSSGADQGCVPRLHPGTTPAATGTEPSKRAPNKRVANAWAKKANVAKANAARRSLQPSSGAAAPPMQPGASVGEEGAGGSTLTGGAMLRLHERAPAGLAGHQPT